MLAGSAIVGMVPGEGLDMWLTVLILLGFHLWTNYQAVSHVVMVVLSRQRTNIVFSDIINALPDIERAAKTDVHVAEATSRLILSPRKVAKKEAILSYDGLLEWTSLGSPRNSSTVIGHADFVGFDKLMAHVPPRVSISSLFTACDSRQSGYVLYGSPGLNDSSTVVGVNNGTKVFICLLADVKTVSTYIQAWVHALLLAKRYRDSPNVQDSLQLLQESRATVCKLFYDLSIEESLRLAGWDMSRCAIERSPTPTIQLLAS
jgi:hypothetical protein